MDQAAAESSTHSAFSKKDELDAKEQRRRDIEALLMPARERWDAVSALIGETLDNYEEEYITYEQKRDIEHKVAEVQECLRENNADPRRALELCDEIQAFYDARTLHKQTKAIEQPALDALIESLRGRADHILEYSNYEQYGLTYTEYSDYSNKWDRVKRLNNSPYADSEEIKALIQEIEQRFDADDMRAWATPLGVRFRELTSRRHHGIWARIRVEGGKVFGLDGEELRTVGIGGSGRSARVFSNSDGSIALQPYFASGNPMGSPIRLEGGAYAVMRDADAIFKVDFTESGEVKQVHAEIKPAYDEAIYEDETYYEAPIDDKPEEVVVAGNVATGLTAMQQAFMKKQEVAPREEKKQESAYRAPMQSRQEAVRLLETERAELSKALDDVGVLLGVAKDLGKRVTEVKTKGDEASNALFEKSRDLLRSLAELRREIEQAPATMAAQSYEARMLNLKNSAESLFKRNAHKVIQEYQEDWIDTLRVMKASVADAIDKHDLAAEMVGEGLVSVEALQELVEEKIEARAGDMLRGKEVDLDSLIEEALNELV